MELRELQYFIAVADHLSFGRAAAALGVAQPAVTRQIQKLEREFGIRLLERHKAGARLTNAGKLFLGHARRVIADAGQLVDELSRARRGETGRLSVGFFTSLVSGCLAELVAAFGRDAPGVDLVLIEGSYTDQIAALFDRRLDLALVANTIRNNGAIRKDDIATQRLWCERVLVALPIDHPLSGAAEVSWRELAKERFVVRFWESGPFVFNYVKRQAMRAGYDAQIDQRLMARENLVGLVAMHRGITVVVESAAGATYPGVIFRPLAGPDNMIEIISVWLRDNANPALKRFLALAGRLEGTA